MNRRLAEFAIACLTMLLLCSVFSLNNPSAPLLVLLSLLPWLGVPAFVAWRQFDHLRRTLYAITDRRALILSVGQPQGTESYPPQRPLASPNGCALPDRQARRCRAASPASWQHAGAR